MKKPSVFGHLIDWTKQEQKTPRPVTETQFQAWQQNFSFDALQGHTYGQSFCKQFDIADNLLTYCPWSVDRINWYIKKNYVERS